MRFVACALVVSNVLAAGVVAAEAPKPDVLAKQVIDAAGGEAKLLRLFRLREQLNVSSDLNKKPSERTSIIEPPQNWWLGKRNRVKDDKEPAVFLVWAWTLGALTDPNSKIESIPAVMEDGKSFNGLRIAGTITPPLDMYFDPATHRLAWIDWRADKHRFAEWKEYDGVHYPARCVGYKKSTGKPWYFSEIVEIERLTTLPEGLTR